MMIPAVDILDGKVVRLINGNFEQVTVYEEEPMKVIDYISSKNYKRVHIVDLNGSKNKKRTESVTDFIREIRTKYPNLEIQIGGGIRTEEDIKIYKELNCDVIIGSMVILDYTFVKEICKKYDNIIISVDEKMGNIYYNGWTEKVFDKNDLLKRIARDLKVKNIIYTFIENDGINNGTDVYLYEAVRYRLRRYNENINLIISGGVNLKKENKIFDEYKFNYISGRDFYETKYVPDKLVDMINWERNDGLVQVTVQEEDGTILTQAHMSPLAIKLTFETGKMHYYSRSKHRIRMKGETSKNYQYLSKVLVDCDYDAIICVVKQVGNACHLDRYSCFVDFYENIEHFESTQFLHKLEKTISKRKLQMNTHLSDENYELTYTQKLLKDSTLVSKKIIEEAAEFILAKKSDEKIHECADLMYHIMVKMNQDGIPISNVMNELKRRMKKD